MPITVGILSTSANIRPFLERSWRRGTCDRRTANELWQSQKVRAGRHRCGRAEKVSGAGSPAEGQCSCGQGWEEGLAPLAMAVTLQELGASLTLLNTRTGLQGWPQTRQPHKCARRGSWCATCHCLMQDVTPEPLLVLNLHFMPFVEFYFCSLLLQCCLWKWCLLVTAIMEYSISAFYNSAEFCSRIYFISVLFFSLDWEIWPINHISRTSNHLMSFRL